MKRAINAKEKDEEPAPKKEKKTEKGTGEKFEATYDEIFVSFTQNEIAIM